MIERDWGLFSHMGDFKSLRVWQLSQELAHDVYRITREFPGDERFGLASQLRRSSASVGANIAEGCGRKNDMELRRFLSIARGSVQETESHLRLAVVLDLVGPEHVSSPIQKSESISRMLNAMLVRKPRRF